MLLLAVTQLISQVITKVGRMWRITLSHENIVHILNVQKAALACYLLALYTISLRHDVFDYVIQISLHNSKSY